MLFDLDLPLWAQTLQILVVLQAAAGIYVIIFWTPVRAVLPLLPRYFYRTKKYACDQSPEACWLLYELWVQMALAWLSGQDDCLARVRNSWFPEARRFIFFAVANFGPMRLVVSCVLSFVDMTEQQIASLSGHMSSELCGGEIAAADIKIFLRREQERARRNAPEFLGHAERWVRQFNTPWPGAGPTSEDT